MTQTANNDPRPDFPDNAEEFVLTGMFDPNMLPIVLKTGLTAEDFYVPARQTIFREACALYGRDRHFDLVTFCDTLAQKGLLEIVGGKAGFMSQATKYLDTFYIDGIREEHVQAIKGAARRRRATVKLHAALDALQRGEDAAFDILQQTLNAAQENEEQKQVMPLSPFAKKVMCDLEKEAKAHTYITGLRSGHFKLDALTAGFQPGNVYVIAARPSMGKTALALDFLRNVAYEQPEARLLFVSAEMSGKALLRRMIGAEAGLDLRKVVCNMTNGDQKKILHAIKTVKARKNTHLLEAQSINIDRLMAMIRYEHDIQKFDAIFIDYLQLIPGTTQRAALSNVEQITEVSQKLHAMAITLDVPVVVLAQVNRDASGKNPAIHDLKGSGSIEQDADVVILLDRPEVYADASMPQDYLDAVKGLAILDVAKNRNGETGKVCLTFQPGTQRFLDREDQSIPVCKQQTGRKKTKIVIK